MYVYRKYLRQAQKLHAVNTKCAGTYWDSALYITGTFTLTTVAQNQISHNCFAQRCLTQPPHPKSDRLMSNRVMEA